MLGTSISILALFFVKVRPVVVWVFQIVWLFPTLPPIFTVPPRVKVRVLELELLISHADIAAVFVLASKVPAVNVSSALATAFT